VIWKSFFNSRYAAHPGFFKFQSYRDPISRNSSDRMAIVTGGCKPMIGVTISWIKD